MVCLSIATLAVQFRFVDVLTTYKLSMFTATVSYRRVFMRLTKTYLKSRIKTAQHYRMRLKLAVHSWHKFNLFVAEEIREIQHGSYLFSLSATVDSKKNTG